MGLFSKITDMVKEAAPVIGGVVGFGMGGPIGAAIGSGIGGLASGQEVNEALRTAAIGGALGYGAQGLGFSQAAKGGFLPQMPGAALPQAATQIANLPPELTTGQFNGSVQPSMFDKALGFIGDNKLLTAGGIGALAMLGSTPEEEAAGKLRPFPTGKVISTPVTTRDGRRLDLSNPEDLALYKEDKAQFLDPEFEYSENELRRYYHGGEVSGPGTGTSDSVEALLSDGEFVMTAQAVRGAGDGDRDIGAARMYDMMAELEAQA
tara:strand:- start:1005 stop:1796 length:792 start_codon:yes stop_codon:yes gene_type:complete